MSVEDANDFSELDPNLPADSDPATEGAAHIRLLKSTAQTHDAETGGVHGIPEGERALHSGEGVAVDADVWNFSEMPEVDGDPIVARGSNSDGEWTVWADGTLIVTALSPILSGDAFGLGEFSSPYRSASHTFEFAAVFLERPVLVSQCGSSEAGSATTRFVISCYRDSISNAVTETSARFQTGLVGGGDDFDVQIEIQAKGRAF